MSILYDRRNLTLVEYDVGSSPAQTGTEAAHDDALSILQLVVQF